MVASRPTAVPSRKSVRLSRLRAWLEFSVPDVRERSATGCFGSYVAFLSLEDQEIVDMARNRITLTVDETGEMLGISRALAYDLVRRGEIPSVRLGRRIVVPVRQLQALLAGDELQST